MKINEILTVDELVQPSPQELKDLTQNATQHYKDDLYYHKQGTDVTVVAKTKNNVLGLVVGISYDQPQFKQIPQFVVPQNLYSWADDHGQTALNLMKAIIALSPLPVVSDLEMTPPAKKFLQKYISQGVIKAKTLNLNTGDVTPYNVDIWLHDDHHRVLILDQPFGKPINEPPSQIMEYTWNHAQLLRRLGKL